MLTLRTIIATSAGLTLASSTFVAAVQVANFVLGDTAWIAILVGGALCFLAAACFSELNGLLPSAAGIRLYFNRAFNEQVSLTVSLLYMLVVIIGVIGAESYIISTILNEAFPALPPYIWIVIMLILVTGMNIRGIKIAGVFQDLITYSLMVSLVIVSLVALSKINFQLNAPYAPGGAMGMLNAVALGVFLFVGFEWVTPLAEEVTQVKQISRGMMIAIGVLSVIYAVFTVAMTSVVPKETLAASPAPHILFARVAMGNTGAAWMIAVSLAATITTFNAGLISVSRFMYASAREHVLPAVFSKLNMKYFTPWVSILTLLAIGLTVSGIILTTHRYLTLVKMAAAMESIVYTMAGLAVISLRRRMPGRSRPYLIKGGNFIPAITMLVFAVLAAAVMAEDPWTLLMLAVAFLVCLVYVNTAVPYMKKKHEARRPAARRRPVRTAEGADGRE